jgi:hypothetical protein
MDVITRLGLKIYSFTLTNVKSIIKLIQSGYWDTTDDI